MIVSSMKGWASSQFPNHFQKLNLHLIIQMDLCTKHGTLAFENAHKASLLNAHLCNLGIDFFVVFTKSLQHYSR